MSPNKESIEISCVECNTRFRLWVPFDMLRDWEKGTRISCIKCGALHFVRKGLDGFDISRLKELSAEEKKPAPAGTAPAQVKPAPAPPRPQPNPPSPVEPPRVPAYAPETASQEIDATAHTQDTVLVVEDDRLAREMVEGTVKGLGIRLIAAKNATEAIRILRKERITLIVADLYLKNPGDPESLLDGEELLKKMVDSGLNIPSIITTGKDIIDDLVLDPKWFDLHVKGFIQKGNPFWAEELKLKVKEILYKG
ncbi:MAG: response regulator [Deltaproteobacteria bacterium]|nr:response regulator [Deltaproteobacteria bacterium]